MRESMQLDEAAAASLLAVGDLEIRTQLVHFLSSYIESQGGDAVSDDDVRLGVLGELDKMDIRQEEIEKIVKEIVSQCDDEGPLTAYVEKMGRAAWISVCASHRLNLGLHGEVAQVFRFEID